MQKKDKEKVLDAVWTEDHIKSFLDLQAPAGLDVDFHALNTAYKSMRLDDFAIFADLFAASQRNFNGKNAQGETVLDIIKQHHRGTDYARILESHQH